jgi:hypothetical protein
MLSQQIALLPVFIKVTGKKEDSDLFKDRDSNMPHHMKLICSVSSRIQTKAPVSKKKISGRMRSKATRN